MATEAMKGMFKPVRCMTPNEDRLSPEQIVQIANDQLSFCLSVGKTSRNVLTSETMHNLVTDKLDDEVTATEEVKLAAKELYDMGCLNR